MDLNPHQLVHQVVDGVHCIAFHRDDGGHANAEFVKHFFAIDLLKATSDMSVLVIDLAGVTSLDSSALGPLVQKLRDVQERQGRMALAGVQAPALREIFALTRFDKVFRIFPTRAEAIRALTSSSASAT